MNREDLIVGNDEADLPSLLQRWWGWRLNKPFRPICMTVFGDWFIADESNNLHFLDMIEGGLTEAASSVGELERFIADEEQQDRWFLAGWVIAMQNAGVNRPRGSCYAYRLPPILGGPIDRSNLILLYINVWQAICGQLHQQLSQMPQGKRIREFKCNKDGKIWLVTE